MSHPSQKVMSIFLEHHSNMALKGSQERVSSHWGELWAVHMVGQSIEEMVLGTDLHDLWTVANVLSS